MRSVDETSCMKVSRHKDILTADISDWAALAGRVDGHAIGHLQVAVLDGACARVADAITHFTRL